MAMRLSSLMDERQWMRPSAPTRISDAIAAAGTVVPAPRAAGTDARLGGFVVALDAANLAPIQARLALAS